MDQLSSIRKSFAVLLLLFLPSGVCAQSVAPAKTGDGTTQAARDPQKLFEGGEAALHAGKLDEAERAFRQVLAVNPGVAGAYA
jgi:outer membrane protein assembly factor BamD (BamD/ComL family)